MNKTDFIIWFLSGLAVGLSFLVVSNAISIKILKTEEENALKELKKKVINAEYKLRDEEIDHLKTKHKLFKCEMQK